MSSEQFPFPSQDANAAIDPNAGAIDPANTAAPGDANRSTRFEDLGVPLSTYQERGRRVREATRINLDTFQSDEDDLAANFNAWAAEHPVVESDDDHTLDVHSTAAPVSAEARAAVAPAAAATTAPEATTDPAVPEPAASAPEVTKKPNLLSQKAKAILKRLALIGVALYAAITLTACGAANTNAAPDPGPEDPNPSQTETVPIPSYNPEAAAWNSIALTGSEFLDESIDGSFLQYDGGGHDTSYAKDPTLKAQGYPDIYSQNSFANVGYVLTIMNQNDLIRNPLDISADEYAMVEKYNAFREKEKAAFIAVSNNLEGFEGLSYKAAVDKVADMTPFEKQAFQQQLSEYFSNTTFSLEDVTGDITNHYITEDEKGEHDVEAYSSHIDGTSRAIVMTYTDPSTGLQYITRSLARCDNPFIIVERVNPGTGKKDIIVVTKDDPTEFPSTNTEETDKPTDTTQNPTGGKPAGGDPGNNGGKPAGGNPGTENPTNNNPTNNNPDNNNPGDTNPGNSNPTPGDTNPGDTGPGTTPPGTETPPSNPPAEIPLAPKNETAQRDNGTPDDGPSAGVVTQIPVDEAVTPQDTWEHNQSTYDTFEVQDNQYQQQQQQQQQEASNRNQQQQQSQENASRENATRQEAAERAEAQRAEQANATDPVAEAARQEAEAASREQADQASQNANESAATTQEAAAVTERANQEDTATRETAQDNANQAEQENRAEGQANENTPFEDLGNMFDNGDF